MTEVVPPADAERFGGLHVCGANGQQVDVAWYATAEDRESVVERYRAGLIGYDEQTPGDWIRRTDGSFHNVLVGSAGSWPAAWPHPTNPPAHLPTLIMEARGLTPAVPPAAVPAVPPAAEPAASARGARWFAGPPRWLYRSLLAVAVTATLAAASVPGGHLLAALVAGLVWAVLLVATLVRGIGRLVLAASARSGSAAPSPRRRAWPGWIAVALVVAATGALVAVDAPVRVGLALARPDMLAYAEDPSAAAPARVGPYRTVLVERLDEGGARFLVAAADSPFTEAGFAYAPTGRPAGTVTDGAGTRYRDRYRPLGGPWYVWTRTVEDW